MTRAFVAAALAAAAFVPAAHAARSGWCDGVEIGTLCVHDLANVTMDTACPILEGQTVFGITCA